MPQLPKWLWFGTEEKVFERRKYHPWVCEMANLPFEYQRLDYLKRQDPKKGPLDFSGLSPMLRLFDAHYNIQVLSHLKTVLSLDTLVESLVFFEMSIYRKEACGVIANKLTASNKRLPCRALKEILHGSTDLYQIHGILEELGPIMELPCEVDLSSLDVRDDLKNPKYKKSIMRMLKTFVQDPPREIMQTYNSDILPDDHTQSEDVIEPLDGVQIDDPECNEVVETSSSTKTE